jgi:hypothetical protein
MRRETHGAFPEMMGKALRDLIRGAVAGAVDPPTLANCSSAMAIRLNAIALWPPRRDTATNIHV